MGKTVSQKSGAAVPLRPNLKIYSCIFNGPLRSYGGVCSSWCIRKKENTTLNFFQLKKEKSASVGVTTQLHYRISYYVWGYSHHHWKAAEAESET
jgi:hypothetical protein